MPTKPTGRPRGRPKGAKNIPSLEDFVADSIAAKPVRGPSRRKRTNKKARGPWANMTPEERSAYSRELVARRDPSKGRKPGAPANLTAKQYRDLVESQKPIIQRIIKKMRETGELPDDPLVIESFEKAATVLRTAQDNRHVLAAARLLLDFKKAKPVQKQEVTIKTAEDLLDEIGEDEE